MNAYILVIYLISPNGVSIQSTQEFANQQACQVIANSVNQDVKRNGQNSLKAVCNPKN
jgi:subtilisin-like proprotein convertase family protein